MLRKPAVLLLSGLLLLILPGSLVSAETVCSRVAIEIAQELTLERIAFDAKLVITNNMPDKALESLSVEIDIRDFDGNDVGALFFIRNPELTNISDVSGSGSVESSTRAEIHWLIIPSPGAGGENPDGRYYWVGATLRYKVAGIDEVVEVIPDRIQVRPEPQLVLDYFVPFKVEGDNPFTAQVETPIPFPLAVRLTNDGFGQANSLKIDSAQPVITDNKQGLLVDFKLLGASVNDTDVEPTLTVNIGDLPSKNIAIAYWEMISTLSGRFESMDISFTHAADLGGELTSLIREINTYYFSHFIKVDFPDRDDTRDILADTDNDADHLPDVIFESEIPEGSSVMSDSMVPVSIANLVYISGRPTAQFPEVDVSLSAPGDGWIYTEFEDPSAGKLILYGVRRADGKSLVVNNFWTSELLDENYQKTYKVHFVDHRPGNATPTDYVLLFEQPGEDIIPPVTSLRFEGPFKNNDGAVFITPETMILFISDDNEGGSGVSQMLRNVSGVDDAFNPAIPLRLDAEGEALVEYYSVDRAGNQEDVKSLAVNVDASAPVIQLFEASPDIFSPLVPNGIGDETKTALNVVASDMSGTMQAEILITAGAEFNQDSIVRTIQRELASDLLSSIEWDGLDNDGGVLPSGVYTVRLKVTDGLETGSNGHVSFIDITVELQEWFKGIPVDANTSAPQENPSIYGNAVVWQDKRNGSWDIYLKTLQDGSYSQAIVSNQYEQTNPSFYGDIIVWQDMRNGNWDIYGYRISTNQELVIYTGAGNQTSPVVNGEYIAWQDDIAGTRSIYLYTISTGNIIQITSHERDQINPSLTDSLLAWEDYRHGLPEIYTYDLVGGSEGRLTYNTYAQIRPALSPDIVVWTDMRDGDGEIYYMGPDGEQRATYMAGLQTDSTVYGTTVVYTSYTNGMDDADLAFFDTLTGVGTRLTTVPEKQEKPSLGADKLAWQDYRDGISQIYWSDFTVNAVPVSVKLKAGFNLISVGQRLVSLYNGSSALISSGFGIDKVVTHKGLNGIYLESGGDVDVPFAKGMAIGVYATGPTSIEVMDAGESFGHILYPGTNYIGMFSVPYGYTAFDMIASIGFDDVVSLKRFNNVTGAWETASVMDNNGSLEAVGMDFPINTADGLVVEVKRRLDGWMP